MVMTKTTRLKTPNEKTRRPLPTPPHHDQNDPKFIPEVIYSGPSDPITVKVPAETIRGILSSFEGPPRAVLVGLFQGVSKGMAAARAGVSPSTLLQWERRDPAYAKAVSDALALGFAGVLESELYRRAMAGVDDRGSMRALELVVKARDSTYRDKAGLEVTLIHRAQEAEAALSSGWESEADPTTP